MWLYIVLGIGYGFAAAVQLGPFQTYLISQTLSKGWKRTFPIVLASLLSDGPIIALCLLVLSQVPVRLQRFLDIAGWSFILYLAYGAYRAWMNFDPNISSTELSAHQGVLKAALVNMLNPNPYLYLTLVTGPILLTAWRETPSNGVGFISGFFVSLIFSLSAIVVVFGTARQFGPKVNSALLGASAIALFCFDLYQLWLWML
jgi:threonine/homoserine/homoserine lactone efflux protein